MGSMNLNLTDDEILVPPGEYNVTVEEVTVRNKSGGDGRPVPELALVD